MVQWLILLPLGVKYHIKSGLHVKQYQTIPVISDYPCNN